MTDEKIAVFKRHFRLGLDDIVEAIGHQVSEDQLSYIPETFPNGYLNGCSTLIIVGALKIEGGASGTVRVFSSEIEEEARQAGVKTIYRLARFSPEEGVRQGKNYGIRRIDL